MIETKRPFAAGIYHTRLWHTSEVALRKPDFVTTEGLLSPRRDLSLNQVTKC